MRPLTMAFALLAFGSACASSSAYAERIASKPVLTAERSPYSVELVSESGSLLDTYTHRGRFYVQGNTGERYSIRVSNPTSTRVEAVISVDGLDVVDGESANFRSKRGYIVPAHGSLNIDGFRVSTQEVAAFRFSSVSSSYAARKGKARNVGVVGVAIFAERAQEVLVIPGPIARRDDFRKRPNVPGRSFDGDQSQSAPPAAGESRASTSKSARGIRPSDDAFKPSPQREDRAGLGTAFGEHRQSAVRFTTFVRANSKKPTAIAELRYNDSQGLRALGIRLRDTLRVPDQDELALRESASSFPDSRFAQPPPR